MKQKYIFTLHNFLIFYESKLNTTQKRYKKCKKSNFSKLPKQPKLAQFSDYV